MADKKESTYYYVNGKQVELTRQPGEYAVKFKPGVRSDSPVFSERARAFLRDESQSVDFLPLHSIHVYHTDSSTDPISILSREEGIEFIAATFRQTPENPDIMFVTNRFLAQFKPEVTQEQIARLNNQFHVRIIEPLGYAENGYLLEVQGGLDSANAIDVANAYYESELTLFAEPDFIRKLSTRYPKAVSKSSRLTENLPRTDSEHGDYLAQQWHLKLAQVVAAWELPGLNFPQGAPSITVAVLDDGLDATHPEFNLTLSDGSSKLKKQFDFSTNVADASPKATLDMHGTACSGLAVAGGSRAR